MIKGLEFEKAGAVPPAQPGDSDEQFAFIDMLTQTLEKEPGKWAKIAASVRGVTEETTTGVHRLYHYSAEGVLPFPAMNVNDAVTKSKFDNKYGTRHSVIDGLNRGTDMLIGGKKALVCGYGDVGKGVSEERRAELTERLEEDYSDLELTVYEGGQEVYDYLVSLE